MTEYSDVLEALVHIRKRNADIGTLYLSEDTIEQWADSNNFSTGTDKDGHIGVVDSIDVETDDDERLTARTPDGEKVTISVPP